MKARNKEKPVSCFSFLCLCAIHAIKNLQIHENFYQKYCKEAKKHLLLHPFAPQNYMVVIAQLVRASDCGSEGRGFEPRFPPKKKQIN